MSRQLDAEKGRMRECHTLDVLHMTRKSRLPPRTCCRRKVRGHAAATACAYGVQTFKCVEDTNIICYNKPPRSPHFWRL